jgi:hypothetical protein
MEQFRLFREKWEDARHIEWRPEDMQDDHLENTIVMLENNAEVYKARYTEYLEKAISGMSATMDMKAITGMEIERINRMNPLNWLKSTPTYKVLMAELLKRAEAKEREAANRAIQEAMDSKCGTCAKGQAVASMNDVKALAKQLDENEKAGLCKVMKGIVEGKYKITPCGQIFEV